MRRDLAQMNFLFSLRRINVEILDVTKLRPLFHLEPGHDRNFFVAFAQRGYLMSGGRR